MQILNDPVPQMGREQLADFLQKIDAPALVEQVIAVPKISLDWIPQRSACRRPRRAAQLVEVPTIVSYSSLQRRTAEQIIDIPVPRGGGLHGPGSAASSSHSPGAGDEAFTGFFRTFPQILKSAPLGPHSGSELCADFNPWTPAAHADSMALEEDELDTGSELESEPEEDAVTRFAGGFRPLRVCMRFLELQMGRAVRGCA